MTNGYHKIVMHPGQRFTLTPTEEFAFCGKFALSHHSTLSREKCMKTTSPFRPDDLQDLALRGITPETILSQIETFTRGLPFIALQRPCTVGDGITVLSPAELERYGVSHAHAAALGRLMKFVPASGAASRMFELFLSVAERTAALSEEQIATAARAGDRDHDPR
jgi:hypothetical protein